MLLKFKNPEHLKLMAPITCLSILVGSLSNGSLPALGHLLYSVLNSLACPGGEPSHHSF